MPRNIEMRDFEVLYFAWDHTGMIDRVVAGSFLEDGRMKVRFCDEGEFEESFTSIELFVPPKVARCDMALHLSQHPSLPILIFFPDNTLPEKQVFELDQMTMIGKKTVKGRLRAAMFLPDDLESYVIVEPTLLRSGASIYLHDDGFGYQVHPPVEILSCVKVLALPSQDCWNITLALSGDEVVVYSKGQLVALEMDIETEELKEILEDPLLTLRVLYFENGFHEPHLVADESFDVEHEVLGWSLDGDLLLIAAPPHSEGRYLDDKEITYYVVVDDEIDSVIERPS